MKKDSSTMKALVYYGPYDLRLEEKPKPKAGSGDVIVKVILSTICGSELHMLHGLLPVEKGLILGHEPVGIVDEIGEGVEGFEVGGQGCRLLHHPLRLLLLLPERHLFQLREGWLPNGFSHEWLARPIYASSLRPTCALQDSR